MTQYSAVGLSERRGDLLLRTVIARCQDGLSNCGFQVESQGTRNTCTWVQFSCPARAPNGRRGALLLLVAHDAQERALLVETRFADAALKIDTPHHKRVHRYDDGAEMPEIVSSVADALGAYLGDLRA